MITRRIKNDREISVQMERIYNLYLAGYGTMRMVRACEERAYKIIIMISY